MAIQLVPNVVIQNKITDITNTELDTRGLFTVDTSLTAEAGMTVKIWKYTYSGTVETLAKGADGTETGAVATSYKDYTVARKQTEFSVYDDDIMSDGNLMNVLTDGAGKVMVNGLRSEYFTELGDITNHFDAKAYTSLYEAVVDAVASLPKASEQDINELFIIMGADARAKVRKDSLFEASRQGEILYTGQFGTIAGIPCVYSNLVPAGTVYLTEKKAITYFAKKEGFVETSRNIGTKQTRYVYSRYGIVALTDDTRSAVIDLNTTYSAVDTTDSGYASANPKTEGWYEKTESGLYFLSQKTTTATGTFYEAS